MSPRSIVPAKGPPLAPKDVVISRDGRHLDDFPLAVSVLLHQVATKVGRYPSVHQDHDAGIGLVPVKERVLVPGLEGFHHGRAASVLIVFVRIVNQAEVIAPTGDAAAYTVRLHAPARLGIPLANGFGILLELQADLFIFLDLVAALPTPEVGQIGAVRAHHDSFLGVMLKEPYR